ncbi:MAG: MaoC/PaaZ C-terminal domain-containing protein [Solirubrobacterales bacterium]
MARRTLDGPPSVLPLYARAAAPLLPGTSRLPFVPGGGGEIPSLELELRGVGADADRLAAYARACGFALRDTLPPTYPQVLAFPLQMALLADGSFPFGAVGLVHLENQLEQRRPVRISEPLDLAVHPTPLRPHPKGQTFSILTEARVDGELAWSARSTMLHRGKPTPAELAETPVGAGENANSAQWEPVETTVPASARWRLGEGLGRRYASVSGDRNPIHMHALTAKPLGFPAAIAHGMWTKARCLAALENRIPDAFAVEARFRKPILLPARVEFASQQRSGGQTAFTVRAAQGGAPHLDGLIRPTDEKPKAKRGRQK